MFAISTYNLISTNYAEKIKEKCDCVTILKCYVHEKEGKLILNSIICPYCTTKFPETMSFMAERIKNFSRGLWNE